LAEDGIEAAQLWADKMIALFRNTHPNHVNSFLAVPPEGS
jgi:hypothetical protein